MTRSINMKQGEQAYILIWVLFFFALFSLLALYFMDASTMEALISSNHRHDVQAFALADGGALLGAEQIYTILVRDYSTRQEIPQQISLNQQEWRSPEAGSVLSFYLDSPRLVSQTDGECNYQFFSQGNCAPAQKKVQVEVCVKYIDYYQVQYAEDGTAILIFDHREFIYPVKISALKI